MNDWPVKLPSRIRPAIEQIAREEFLPVPNLVRQLRRQSSNASWSADVNNRSDNNKTARRLAGPGRQNLIVDLTSMPLTMMRPRRKHFSTHRSAITWEEQT
jgi:hypothetical protein